MQSGCRMIGGAVVPMMLTLLTNTPLLKNRRRGAALLIALALVVGAAAWAVARRGAPPFHGRAVEPPRPAPDFTLTGPDGQPFRLSQLQGRAVVLFFGYTHCPDVCPATLSTFEAVKQALGAEGERVRFVFVTVDPERDTPQRLREYLRRFDPEFIGLSGDPETLAAVREAYGIYAARAGDHQGGMPSGHYVMTHTATSFVIDPAGRLRVSYSFGTPADQMAADLRRILAD